MARPKPTELKTLAGTLRRDRVNAREPRPPHGPPRCPSWLDAIARETWRELSAVLGRMRVLTKADRVALALGCAAVSDYRRARAVLEREGDTYRLTTESGEVIRPRPEVAIASDAWKRARAMLIEFGLTPAARPRVNARDPDAGERSNAFRFLLGERRGGAAGHGTR